MSFIHVCRKGGKEYRGKFCLGLRVRVTNIITFVISEGFLCL